MAQVESPTAQLYLDMALAMKDASNATATHVGLETASCAAFDEDTDAFSSECADTGLARTTGTQSIQTTTKTDDTYRLNHQFTKGSASPASSDITGFLVMTAAANGDHCHGWCCFAATVSLENTDQLTCQMNFQFKKD